MTHASLCLKVFWNKTKLNKLGSKHTFSAVTDAYKNAWLSGLQQTCKPLIALGSLQKVTFIPAPTVCLLLHKGGWVWEELGGWGVGGVDVLSVIASELPERVDHFFFFFFKRQAKQTC